MLFGKSWRNPIHSHAVQLLTTEEAAQRLHLHPETVRRFLREGLLRGVKIGRQHRIEESEVAAYIERLKTAQSQSAGQSGGQHEAP